MISETRPKMEPREYNGVCDHCGEMHDCLLDPQGRWTCCGCFGTRLSAVEAELDTALEAELELSRLGIEANARAEAAESECEQLRERDQVWAAEYIRRVDAESECERLKNIEKICNRKDEAICDQAAALEEAREENRPVDDRSPIVQCLGREDAVKLADACLVGVIDHQTCEIERLRRNLRAAAKMCTKHATAYIRADAAEAALADLRDRVEVIARASEKAFVSNRKKNPDYVYTGLEADMAMVDAELALLRALLAKGNERGKS